MNWKKFRNLSLKFKNNLISDSQCNLLLTAKFFFSIETPLISDEFQADVMTIKYISGGKMREQIIKKNVRARDKD